MTFAEENLESRLYLKSSLFNVQLNYNLPNFVSSVRFAVALSYNFFKRQRFCRSMWRQLLDSVTVIDHLSITGFRKSKNGSIMYIMSDT